MEQVSLDIVGDVAIGKNNFFIRWRFDYFQTEYDPRAIEEYARNVQVDDKPVAVVAHYTGCQDDFEQLRTVQYSETDIHILSFSVVSRKSFDSIEIKWVPEVRHHCPNDPILLLGLQCDARGESYVKDGDKVTKEEALHLAKKIDASGYCEASAKTGAGVDDVIECCVRAVLNAKDREKSGKSRRFALPWKRGQTKPFYTNTDKPIVPPLPEATSKEDAPHASLSGQEAKLRGVHTQSVVPGPSSGKHSTREHTQPITSLKNAKTASSQLQNEVFELQQQLTQANSDNQQLQQQLTQAKTDNQQLQQHNESLQTQVAQASRYASQLQQQLTQVNELRQRSDTENQQLIATLRQEIDALHHQVNSISAANHPQNSQEVEFWQVSSAEVTVREDQLLGGGAWGYVAKGTFRGTPVAVKRVHPAILQMSTFERIRREIRTMAQIRHPNLVLFIAAVLNEQTGPMIVTELLDMSLRSAYQANRIGTNKRNIFRDMSLALVYLHGQREPIIHRDVSSANVLLLSQPNDTWLAKLSDFGSANLARYATTPGEGAILYTAPEAYPHPPTSPTPRPPQTTKIDVYSFGVVVCEVATGVFPEFDKFRDLLVRVGRVWPQIHPLINSCISHSAQDRPTMDTVLSQIKQLDWEP